MKWYAHLARELTDGTPLIHTGLWPGAGTTTESGNRLNGFPSFPTFPITRLKPGVTEIRDLTFCAASRRHPFSHAPHRTGLRESRNLLRV